MVHYIQRLLNKDYGTADFEAEADTEGEEAEGEEVADGEESEGDGEEG